MDGCYSQIWEGVPVRIALAVVLANFFFACSTGNPAAPSTPTPAPNVVVSIWGLIVDESGFCITGASAEVVSGQGAGRKVAQGTPCGGWDYGGGFVFDKLTPGAEMTIRASAPGFVAIEKTIVPTSGKQSAIMFEPARAR